jgi:hypothetical protein
MRQQENNNESTISDLVLEPMTNSAAVVGSNQYCQKPDRSSLCYATQLEDGEYYKPNARADD